MLDGVQCNSFEGFIQSVKYKDANMQAEICKGVGLKAKRSGQKKNWQRTQTLYWKGQAIKRDSKEYQDLLDRAYNSLFRTNSKARKALLATGDAVLTHSIGHTKINETVLTKKEFCSRLMKIRLELKTEEFLEF